MYCKNCGSEIAEGAKFCSQCGTLVESAPQPAAAPVTHDIPAAEQVGSFHEHAVADETYESPRKPVIEDVPWDVGDYPSRDRVEKTEEINFNWHARPADLDDAGNRVQQPEKAAPEMSFTDTYDNREDVLQGKDLERSIFGETPERSSDGMSAAERIDKFYTFNKKNEEFQQLLDREYRKVKQGNALQQELSDADQKADERFQVRYENSSMEDFLEAEGINKPYQPKAFESDVLKRIEEQEAMRDAQRREEEARLAAIEQARQEAEAKRKEEEEAARLAELARKKAEEEAIAAEQARIKAREEARLRAEEEARLRAEEEARRKEAEEARLRAEEEARIKAEADLKAQREAARIKAQQEARLAAKAEAKFKAEQQKRQFAEQEAREKLEAEQKRITEEANQAVAQEEVRRVLEQTARMQREEEEKIRAAVAGIKAGAGRSASQLSRSEVEEAHRATRNQINEMTKARDEFFAEFEHEQPRKAEQPVTGRETMLSGGSDMSRTRVVDKAAVLAGVDEPTQVISRESMRSAADSAAIDEFFGTPAQDVQPQTAPQELQDADLDDLLGHFESVDDKDTYQTETPAATRQMSAEQAQQIHGGENLGDTIVVPHDDKLSELPANDFDSYGNEEAQNYINQQKAQQAQDDFYDDSEELSPKEIRRREKEQRRLEKQQAKEAKKAAKNGGHADTDFIDSEDDYEDEGKGGGKGRIVLKIILVLLIVVLAFELVCIGIRVFASQSKAAEFVDQQINKVVQLISGDDTQMSFAAAQARVEPKEDKTDLINQSSDRNINKNIKEIVYNADLNYDEERDGQVSDLVLSQPMTVVEWGRDSENYPVYYDTEVVGEIIEFEARKYDLMNSGDESVLGMIDESTKLYKQTSKLKNKKSGDFTRLEIGEIRQAGSNYYVWVKEVIGDKETELVYSMYPEKQFTMKMAARYKV